MPIHNPDLNYVSLEDNSSREIDNPLARIYLTQLDEDAKVFARRISGKPDYTLWIKAARIARDPLDYENVQGITDQEVDAIKNERKRGFWGQSRTLRVTITTLCLAAVIQGWSQTGLNGANQNWGLGFGLTDSQGAPLNTAAVWIYAGVNATVYLTASFFGCWLSDPLQGLILGRRGAIFISGLFCLAAAIGSAFAGGWVQLLGCRAVLGAGMGAKAAVTPIYGAEVSPTHLRGALVTNWQMFNAFGIMLGFSANLILANVGELGWRVQLASLAVPSICLLCLVPTIPESPRWLLKKGRLNEAFASFCALRETPLQAASELFYANAQVQAEIRLLPIKDTEIEAQENRRPYTVAHPADVRRRRTTDEARDSLSTRASVSSETIRHTNDNNDDTDNSSDWDCTTLRSRLIRFWHSLNNEHEDPDLEDFQRCARGTYYVTRILQLFRIKRTRRAAVAAAIVNIAQQLCGVNVLQFYSSTFFRDVTVQRQTSRALWLSWAIGIGNFVFTIPVYWMIDRGLKTIPFDVFESELIDHRGQGPVPFAYSSEVFPLINREAGMSFAVFVNFFGAGILALCVPQLTLSLAGGSWEDRNGKNYTNGQAWLLGIFAILSVVAFLLIFFFVPETAGATLGTESGLNYISLEELNYIFGVPTMKHASYQLRHMLPWGLSMVEYALEKYILRREVEKPLGSRQVYSWVSIRSLAEEQQKREQKQQQERENMEMTELAPTR